MERYASLSHKDISMIVYDWTKLLFLSSVRVNLNNLRCLISTICDVWVLKNDIKWNTYSYFLQNFPHLMNSHLFPQMRQLGDELGEGDVILSNHPCAGGSHLPDLTVITPVRLSLHLGLRYSLWLIRYVPCYTPASTKLKVGILVSPCPSVHPFVHLWTE